jgi:hypothetical protein
MNDLMPLVWHNRPTPHFVEQIGGLDPVLRMSFQKRYDELVFLERALDDAVSNANLSP